MTKACRTRRDGGLRTGVGEAGRGPTRLGGGVYCGGGAYRVVLFAGERMLGTSQPTLRSPSPVVGCVDPRVVDACSGAYAFPVTSGAGRFRDRLLAHTINLDGIPLKCIGEFLGLFTCMLACFGTKVSLNRLLMN